MYYKFEKKNVSLSVTQGIRLTSVEPMTFHTPVGRFTTELQGNYTERN